MSDDHEVTEAEQPKPEEAKGVFVHVSHKEDGTVTAEAVPVGDVRLSEIDTILKLAQRGWAAKIGVS